MANCLKITFHSKLKNVYSPQTKYICEQLAVESAGFMEHQIILVFSLITEINHNNHLRR